MLFRLQEGIAMKMHSHKHILIYDRLWWIQGQRAQLLQKHHPHLEIMSYRDFMNLIKHKGANRINQQYDVVSTLGSWSAERFIQRNVHVHSSVVGSYSYVAKNQHYFREWSNEMRPNYKYMKQVIQKIDRVGAVNPKLAATIKKYCPNKQVHYINRKSTRLNSSHVSISYAVFCLKKKKTQKKHRSSQRSTKQNTRK